MIRVLVVEDSDVIREFLVGVLSADPDVEVVGTAADGEAALVAVRRHRPDVVTMDIHMPKLNGLEATRRLMESDPVPIVIVSGSRDPDEAATTFTAMEAGALAVVSRPPGSENLGHDSGAREIVRTVKLMSEVKVVRRRPPRRRAAVSSALGEHRAGEPHGSDVAIVGIGASTGGPPVLQTVLAALPASFPVPIVIVQHMAPGFTDRFAEWLGQGAALGIAVAREGEQLLAGRAYLAPDQKHLRVTRQRRVTLDSAPPEHGLRPSVSVLFRSLVEVYGRTALAGLLSGMGSDGVEELHLLKECGATTFVQDAESSVVHGMAARAIELDAAMLVLPPARIAGMLTAMTARDVWSPAP